MTEKDVRQMVGSVIFARGKEYYLQGKVLELQQKGNTLFADVQGSKRRPYSVEVEFSRDGSVIDHRCDCPYGYGCKHLAAALLAYISIGGPEAISENPLSRLKDIGPQTIRPEFRKSPEPLVVPSFGVSSGVSVSAPKKGERWKAAFIVSESHDYGTEKSLNLRPALRFIRKDGDEGRVAKFKDGLLTEPPSAEELPLLEALLGTKKQTLPFFLFFNRFREHPELKLFGENGNPLGLEKIVSAELVILPGEYDERSGNLSYRRSLRFNETGKEIGQDMLRYSEVLPDGTFLFLSAGNVLYYLEGQPKAARFFQYLLGNLSRLTFSDAAVLAESVRKDFSGLIRCDFTPGEVKVEHPRPVPVLVLKKGWFLSGKFYDLAFDYDGWTVMSGFMRGEDSISRRNADGSLSILLRRKDFESEMRYFTERLMQTVEGELNKRFRKEHLKYLHAAEFLSIFGERLMKEGYAFQIEGASGHVSGLSGFKVRTKSGIDWFDVEVTLLGNGGVSLGYRVQALIDGWIEHEGNLFYLTPELLEKLRKLEASGISGRVSRSDLGGIHTLYEEFQAEGDSDFQLQLGLAEKLKKVERIEKAPLPSRFSAALRDYQKAGYDWLYFLQSHGLNGLLADDMGLGKTVQALALLSRLKEEGKLKKALLIVPVSTMANWEAEIGRFAPGLGFIRHHGQGRDKETDFGSADLVLSSYHTLRNDIELFRSVEWDVLLLDEAQTIKNAESQAFKSVRLIPSNFRLSLTGTPVENRTLELWAQMDFLYPGLLGTRKEFTEAFAKPIEEEKDHEASECLRKRVFPFILRRRKGDVLKDLPEKEEMVMTLEMEDDQKALYERMKKRYAESIGTSIREKGLERSAVTIFEGLLRLRQIALFPDLADEKNAGVSSCKFEAVKRLLVESAEEGHKILLFSQFVGSLKKIEDFLQTEGLDYAYLDGQTKDRGDVVKRFQEDPGCRIFLLSLKAGGVGINLTAADYVILFDPWWNPAVESQAVDRSHRIGQKKRVMVYKPIVRGTVEEKMLELQNRKRELVSELVAEESGIFKSLTGEEVMALFG